jgi:Na+/glutamate symporter
MALCGTKEKNMNDDVAFKRRQWRSRLVLLLIVVAVLAGDAANQWARAAGLVLPGFLTAMLAGVAITNLADAIGARIDLAPIQRGGEIGDHVPVIESEGRSVARRIQRGEDVAI